MEGRRSGRALVTCAYCEEDATKILEMYVSSRAPKGSGRNRGQRLQSVTRRVCDQHARMFFGAVQAGPRGQLRERPVRRIDF